MSDVLMLQEATIVFNTFGLVVDFPAFTPRQKVKLAEAKKACKETLGKLVKESRILRENQKETVKIQRAIIKESIKIERMTILEAASSMSVNMMVNQMSGMTQCLQILLSSGMGDSLVPVLKSAAAARDLARDIEDLEGAGMHRDVKSAMEQFKKYFADVAGAVKGLVAISDELVSGKLADIVRPVIEWVIKRKQKTVSALETFASYDQEVNKVAGSEGIPMKRGLFGKMFGGPAKTNTAEQFKRAFDEIVKTKAPSFAKSAHNFGAMMMELPLKQIITAFNQFDNKVSSDLDLDFIASMSKQSFGSALKGLFGGAAHGHVGVGMK